MTYEEQIMLEYKAFRKGAFNEVVKTLMSFVLLAAVSVFLYFLCLPEPAPTVELMAQNPSKYLEVICEQQGNNNCWLMAASAAASYRADLRKDSADVLEYVNSKHRVKEAGGDSTHEALVYEFYELESTSGSEKLTVKEVVSIVDKGYPIYCVIATKDFKLAHAVVICGYELDGDNVSYFIMDPMTTFVSAIEVDQKTNMFKFKSNDVLYTNWVRYRY